MGALLEIIPYLIAMAVLTALSGFFSAAEAALFYLRWQERRALAEGSPAQQKAIELLADPDRLLSAVLFWNFVINIAYFTLASIAGIQLERGHVGQSITLGFTFGALLVIIFFSEMLPKSLAVLRARRLASIVGPPLSTAVRLLDPIMPTLRAVNLFSRRLIWPGAKAEPYLEVADLERAIQVSTSDEHLLDQEQTVLNNIVSLSDIHVDEWMRPRRRYRVFRPPVSLSDLEGQMTPSGYLFITERDSDEVALSLYLKGLSEVPEEHLEHLARPVAYVPWCATVADTLQELRTKHLEAAAVVNEMGETIGVITLEDILDTVFSERPGRSERLFNRDPIQALGPDLWQVTGLTNVRRLARYFDVELPPSRNVTVGGIIQETLERLPEENDHCQWGAFDFRVVEVSQSSAMLVHVTLVDERANGQ